MQNIICRLIILAQMKGFPNLIISMFTESDFNESSILSGARTARRTHQISSL